MQDPACRLDWGTAALQHSLQAAWPGLAVQVLAQAGSTNSLLLERGRIAAAQPTLLVAEQQTAGRGRLGRAWQAEAGASLSFSLGLPLAPRQWQGLSLAVGLALAEALEPWPDRMHGPRIGLKWPNDLLLRSAPEAAAGAGKLCGVLIETLGSEPAGRWCVIGVGLNVAPLAAPPQAARPAWLQQLQPQATPPAALAQLALPLLWALRRFEAEGFAPLLPAYTTRDLLLGQRLQTSNGLQGLGAGVDAEGALLLRTGPAEERLERILSGEVSVRFAGQALPAGGAC